MWLGVAVLLASVGVLYRAVVGRTDGTFCYPLDDAFIHMAMGRTLAQHGVYGVTPGGFAAASSSIAWPLVLALVDCIVGDHLLTPLVLNIAIGAGIVAYLGRVARQAAPGASPLAQTIWLLVAVAAIPLPTIVILGMEHTAHILACLAFVALAADWLAGENPKPPRALLGVAFAASCLRYESLFLAGAVAIAGVSRRRPRGTGLVVAAAVVPAVLFAAYSLGHGWKAVPNSVLLKGNRIHFVDLSDVGDFLGGDFVTAICAEPHMLAALLVAAVAGLAALRQGGAFSPHALRIWLSVVAGVAHVQFASLNWFFRYEAYAVALLIANAGLLVLDSVSRPDRLPYRRAVIAGATAAAVLGLSPLARRAIHASQWTPEASANVYDQQVQTALFLNDFFSDGPVVVNDIGAVAYYGGEPIVDLGGLSSMDAARSKHFQMFHPPAEQDVARMAAGAPVAVVYDAWVPYRPPTWTRLGRWRVPECRSCGEPAVDIYATSPEAVPRVWRALSSRTMSLPEEVRAGGLYLDEVPSQDPGSPDYRLGEDDTVLLTMPGFDPPLVKVTVDEDGRIKVPHADSVLVRGVKVQDVGCRVARAVSASYECDIGRPGMASARLLEPRRMRFAVAGREVGGFEFRRSEAPTVRQVATQSGLDEAQSRLAYVLRRGVRGYVRVDLGLDDPLCAMDVLVFP